MAVLKENVIIEPSLTPVGLGAPGCRPGIILGIIKIKNMVATNPNRE
jgi:hypothetical protein